MRARRRHAATQRLPLPIRTRCCSDVHETGGNFRLCGSWHENRRALESAGTKIAEYLIGLTERIASRLGDDADFRYTAEEINSVVTREVGDRHELPLFP